MSKVFNPTAARWVELLSGTDTISVLDETGSSVCRISRGVKGIVFVFRSGLAVEVPSNWNKPTIVDGD